jgi:branched-chain amino acid transport system ATP-binding protein
MSTGLLEIRGATKNFRGLRAVSAVDFAARVGEVVGLIGPNGAGKTTLFNLITNTIPLTEGRIFWNGSEITGMRTDRIARQGVLRTYQIPRIFSHIDLYDNVRAGCHQRAASGIWDAFLRTKRHHRDEEAAHATAERILRFFGMESQRRTIAANLPYGQMKRLAIAIVMAAEPQMLLLDEPAGGLNPQEKLALSELIGRIRASGVGICLVDHDMRFIMDVCDRIIVLNHGRKIAEGSAVEIQNNEEVIEAYLGRRRGAEGR